MIEEPPLLTIKRPSRRPTEAQIAAFEGLPVSVVSDSMAGAGVLKGGIRPMMGEPAVVGPALTVGCGAADILALFAAIKFVAPGDVVVVSVDGHQGCAVVGDRVSGMLSNAGATGFVCDGPVRDANGIDATGLRVWCTGRNPATPYGNGPGTVGLPIQLAGQEVETGDIIVADGDGVVVVPFERIDEVAAKARATVELEKALDAQVSAGLTVPPSIEKLLESDRVIWID